MPYVNNDGLDIYYEVHGSGQRTLFFAHGMGGNAAIWFNQIAHYANGYKVIAIDHRHFGRSSCPESEFKPALFPDDALKVLEAENIDSATFICQSMGGWTGSQLAVNHPDKVDALIMSHTPGIFEHESAVNDQRRLAAIISEGLMPALAHDFPAKNPVGAALYGAINRFNNIENSIVPRAIGAAKLGVNTDTLKDYKIPTLFLTGNLDVLFEADYIKSLAATLPGAEYVNLGEVGHSSYFELPDAFNKAVDSFLASHGIAAS